MMETAQGVVIMHDWMWFAGIVVVWVVATQWLLPKLGIST
jgi:hypothetical protein